MTQAKQPKGLIWLASYPKSGNTWTRSFLHNLLAIMRGEAEDAWDINQMNEFSTSSQNTKKYEELAGKPWQELDAAGEEAPAAQPEAAAEQPSEEKAG